MYGHNAAPFKGKKMNKNSLRETRESLMMSKAELSRNAGISPITITRIENGKSCRMETKRKILLALGLKLSEKAKVFH
jgi:DNA-binding XRE family transcriptional regulator